MLSQSIQFMKVSFLIFIIQKYHKTDKEWSYVLYTVFITTLPLVLPCDASFTVVQGALWRSPGAYWGHKPKPVYFFLVTVPTATNQLKQPQRNPCWLFPQLSKSSALIYLRNLARLLLRSPGAMIHREKRVKRCSLVLKLFTTFSPIDFIIVRISGPSESDINIHCPQCGPVHELKHLNHKVIIIFWTSVFSCF